MSKIKRSGSAGEGNSTSITDLPQTILIGIISRVPLRCAKRCSAVCKTWYKLLVKDEATSSYLQHWYGGGGDDQMSSRRNSSSFALLTNMTTSFPGCSNRLWSWVVAAAYSSAEEDTVGIWPRLMLRPCNDDDNEQHFRYSNEVRGGSGQRMEVVACCNDVLLCEEWRSAANDSAAYCVWEPVSGEHNWVPLPVINHDRNSEQRRRLLYGLASEPDGSFTVIRITASERPSGSVLMHTFSNSSREDSWAWKEHRVDWPAGQEFLWVEHHPQGVMYKGFMFWLGAKHALFGVDLGRRDLHHHPVLVTLPPEFRYIGNECLGVCRGSLTIVQMSDNPSHLAAAYVAIWILNHGSSRSGNSVDEFGSWLLYKRVSLQQVIGSADPFRRPPTSDLSGDASLPRMGRLKLLGRHPYELDIVYFRVWRTVFSLDLSSKGAPLRRLFVYPSDTYPLNTSMGLPVNSFTFIPQWRPTPIRTFAVDSLFINYLECM